MVPDPLEAEERGKHVNMKLTDILKVRVPQASAFGIALIGAVWFIVNVILPGHITVIIATKDIIVQTGAL